MISQSETLHVLKLQTSDDEPNNHSSLLPVRSSKQNSIHTNYQYKTLKQMDIKTVESIEREVSSEETIKPTGPWNEIVKSGDYSITQGQWKHYNPPRTLQN